MESIDESSINLLYSLQKEISSTRILVVGAYRLEESVLRDGRPHPLREVKNLTVIELGSLDPKGIGEYISETYRDNDFPEDFAHFIWERTEGNCLFAVELMGLFVDDQTIVQKQGTTWSLTKELRDIKEGIPKSIDDVIKERVDHITDKFARQILRKASVEGKRFTHDILSQLMLIDDDELNEELSSLTEMLFIREPTESDEDIGSYDFIHSLVHRCIYGRLRRKERADLHKRIGEILEAISESDGKVKQVASTLADHFEEGRVPDKALRYYRIAAVAAEETRSFAEASRLYEKVDQLMEKERFGTLKERVGILIKMGAIYEILGRREESRDTLERSLRLNENLGDDLDKAHNLTDLGITLFHIGDFGKSMDRLEEARKIYEPCKEALSKEDKEMYGMCLDWLGVNHRNLDDMGQAEKFHQEALSIAEEVGSSLLRARAVADLGAIHLKSGDLSQVIERWKESLQISKEAGNLPWWEVHSTIDVGYIYFLQRDYCQAIKSLEEGIKKARESYFSEETARGLMNKGSVWFAKEDLDCALECYEESLQIAAERKMAKLVWRLRHNIGNVYRMQNKYDDAYGSYKSSIEYLKEMLSGLKSKEEREGFLKRRLDPFRSMILLTLEKEEEECQEFAATFGHNLLTDFLEERRKGVDLDEEERENWNYFFGYYVATE